MGLGGISIWQLLIVLVIVVMLFGTKRLRNLGPDLGAAIKGFKKGLSDEEKQSVEDKSKDKDDEKVIDGEAEKVKQEK